MRQNSLMPRLAANLSTLYPDRPFLDRFGEAARDGFRGVELDFPYEHGVHEIRARLKAYGLKIATFHAPPGDWAAGERGIASLPGREPAFRESMEIAFEFARVLGNRLVTVMAGTLAEGEDPAPRRETLVRNLAWAAGEAAHHGLTLTLEPVSAGEIPGYLLTGQEEAHAIVAEVRSPNLKVQLDLFHGRMLEGDLRGHLRRRIREIGHVQVSGYPVREEPDAGPVDVAALFEQLDHLGYGGWIGCEYHPRGDTGLGLKWAKPWLDPRFR
jgi:2-dehydrotetronate isomerase